MRTRRHSIYSVATFMALSLTLSLTGCDSGEGKTAFVGGTLWNGTGAPPILDAVIIVADGKIEQAGAADEVKVPPKAEVHRLDGKWVIPGLIDGHGHVERWMAAELVAHGVTTVRDAGGNSDSVYTLKTQFDRGQAIGPRMFVAGAAVDRSPPRGTNVGVSTTSEIRRQVGLRALDADYVMLSAQVDDTLFRAALDEAGSLNVTVAAHLGRVNAVTAAGLGLRVIDHLSGVVEAIAPRPDWFRDGHQEAFIGFNRSFSGWTRVDSAGIDSVARILVQAGVAVVPTAFFFEAYANLSNRGFVSGLDLSSIPNERRWNIAEFMQQAGLTSGNFPIFRTARRFQDLFIRRFKALGGLLVAGSNTPYPLMVPGSSLHREIQALVGAGLSERDALLAATRDAARMLGADSIGTVERGSVADFVVLSGNPLEDVARLGEVEMVVIRGQIYSPQDLLTR